MFSYFYLEKKKRLPFNTNLFQILNVYITKYDGGGHLWPIAHNTTVFSLLVAQLIALGVFGLKQSTIASGFTIPLLIGTILFHQYCRQRFLPVFKNNATQVRSLLLSLTISLPTLSFFILPFKTNNTLFVLGSYWHGSERWDLREDGRDLWTIAFSLLPVH